MAAVSRWSLSFRPRIRTILLAVNFTILLLPLGGLSVLRFYDNALIQQTETELIAQGAVLSAAYRQELLREIDVQTLAGASYGVPAAPVIVPSSRSFAPPTPSPDSPLRPVAAHLDLGSTAILPRGPTPVVPAIPPDPIAAAAGARITPLLIATRNVTLAGIRVLDFRGTIVATTRGELGLSLANRDEVARALLGQEVSLLRERLSDDAPPPLSSMSRFTLVRVFVVMPVVESGRVLGLVLLSRSPLPVAKALYEHRFSLLFAAAILLLVVLIMTLITSLTIARPVQALIRQTESLSRGEQRAHTQLERPVTWEIAQLSEAFARMARSLEQRSNYIRTFASNVSHEFKTPLTSIRGSVELLKDHLDDMSNAERDRFLENLEADALRLDRLVRRLLDLARADVLEPAGDRTHALELLDRVVERFRRAGLPVELKVGHGEVSSSNQLRGPAPADASTGRVLRDLVPIDAETLESILSNLLDNARQHAGRDAHVEVTTRSVSEAGSDWLEIDVRDDGPGISPANAARIFDPFFTTARDYGGTGLGLSIVRSLLTAHGGSILLLETSIGTAFRVRLPAT